MKNHILPIGITLFFMFFIYGSAKLSQKNIEYETQKQNYIYNSLDNLNNKFQNIENDIDELKSRINDVESDSDNNYHYDNTNHNDDLEWKIRRQQDDIDRLNNEKDEINDKLEDLEDK